MAIETQRQAVRLRPPREQLDPRAIGWWRVQLGLWFTPPVVVLVVLALILRSLLWWFLGPAIVVVLIAVPVMVLLPLWWFRVHRWEVTDTAVYTSSGRLWLEWRAAPMSRIQTVDTERGPLQQLFGIATLTVTTASAKGAVKIKGLDRAEATDVAERLTRITESVPGDAT